MPKLPAKAPEPKPEPVTAQQLVSGVYDELNKWGHDDAEVRICDQFGSETIITDVEISNGVIFIVIDGEPIWEAAR